MVSSAPLPPSRADSVTLLGGELALDFANTESGRGHDSHQDHLQEARHVAAWLRHAKALGPGEADALAALIARDAAFADLILKRARSLRADLHAIGVAVAHGGAPPEAPLKRLNAFHGHCLACGSLRRSGSAYHWAWDVEAHPLEAALAPVTMSAISILTDLDLVRVKECSGLHCGWLFYDRSKNNSRRWCEMEICGNRAKQRRLRAKRSDD